MASVDDYSSSAERKEEDCEESDDDEPIWDSAVNMYVAANTEEEEGSTQEEPQISGEEMGDLESNHEGDNLDVGHIEGLAGHLEEICSKEAQLGNTDSFPIIRVIQRKGRPDSNAAVVVTTRKRTGAAPKALCDYKLQQRLSSQLKLSAKMKQEAEAAQENGQFIFTHIFGSNCNTIEATLEDTKGLGYGFEQIDTDDKGFYVALDKKSERIFVMFGAGLKLIYRDNIREYVEKAMN
ncbi:hypothetical protein B9Z19DRAFT_1130175 [Tuber borchii]|uniref:Uncharacterized protein n=1 Tax=Tuber borchii TaxID=42251 RepID=A0A2T6ZL37_TUBBO|nr:hypothetical protein B9Z19DRAFT_1130175 [Tuber borchii]